MTAPLRVLHLANDLVDAGNGIIHVMIDLAVEQRRAGLDVAVGAPWGDFADLLARHDVRHIPLAQAGPRRLLTAVGRLSRLLREDQFAIVHAHMTGGAVAARLSAIGTPTRVITHVHNSWQPHARLMGVGHHVIAVSEAVRRDMIRRGIPQDRITTVPNGVLGSVRRAGGSAEATIRLDRPNLLTVAGMYVRKGIDVLLQAFARLQSRVPGLTLYLVGDGPDRGRFEDQAGVLGLQGRAVFLGFRHDVEQLMKQADVFVLASRADPDPLVLGEARGAGCAIVATAVDGIPDALDGGRAGLLVPPGDVTALAGALAEVLQNRALGQELRRNAGQGLERLSTTRMADDVAAVYARVLHHRSGASLETR